MDDFDYGDELVSANEEPIEKKKKTKKSKLAPPEEDFDDMDDLYGDELDDMNDGLTKEQIRELNSVIE